MHRALRVVVKWTLLTALAIGLGTSLGAAYAYNLKAPLPPEEVVGPATPPPDATLRDRDVVAPPPPTLVSPRDGALVSWWPRLAWEPVQDGSNVIYALEVSTDPGFPPETTETYRNLRATEWRPVAPLSPLVTYHWRVYALDASLNQGPWSEAWSFVPVLPAGDAEVAVDVEPTPVP